jgi:HEAT repeat protein
MGLFDIFKSKTKEEKKSNAAAKFAEAAGSRKAQAYDRQEAIEALSKLGTSDAVAALLKRFTFVTDPSITDHEEKQLAFDGIVKAGKSEVIEPVRAFAAKAESINWPMKILRELLDEQELIEELLVWLKKWDTEYAKFIDPKLEILKELADYKHPQIREAVEPFLQDASEPGRYNAVCATLAQKDEAALGPIIAMMIDEESVRIRTKVATDLAELGWEIPDDNREPLRKVLPPQFSIDGSGRVTKR